MAGMGPPPKAAEQRARRNATVAMTPLPAGGRQGDPPPWPLPVVESADLPPNLHDYELVLWSELWATPQAVQWERLRWTREVAQYVRWKSLAEHGALDAGKEARQLGDRLGLTPMSMLRLRWEVVGAPEVEAQLPAPRARAKARSRYSVLKSVGGGDAVAGA